MDVHLTYPGEVNRMEKKKKQENVWKQEDKN